MKTKEPIRGIFKIDYPFYISIYKMAEPGVLKFLKDKISVRIGSHHYLIEKILSLKIIRTKNFQIESWVEIKYSTSNKISVMYLHDYRFFGLLNLFVNGNKRLLRQIKEFTQAIDME